MEWSKGYSVHWRVFEVDPRTWADAGLVDGITSVSIDRSSSADAPLLESGTISFDSASRLDFTERYLRIVMDATQDSDATRVDVATLLCSTATSTIDKGNNAIELTARSVLFPASVRLVIAGNYAPKGADGAQWAASMLRDTITAPVEVQGSFTLETNVVFDVGMSYLECVWEILNAGNFCMQIQGDGTVRILPVPKNPTLLLDDTGAKLLHPSINYEIDWSDIPNRYIAIEGSQMAAAVNDDESSPTSSVTRGYYYDVLDGSPTRVNGESLAQYAMRKLEEESTIPDVLTYSREYHPDILPYSLVRGSSASVGIDGDLRVTEQSLTCDKGITVSEKAQGEIKTWQR